MKECLLEHLREFSVNLKPEIVVVYNGEEPLAYVSLNKEKEKVLVELLSLLARKFVRSKDILGQQEFLYAEGKDYDIFILDIKDDYLIVSFLSNKEKFSLLKLEHEKLKNKLISCLEDKTISKVKESKQDTSQETLQELKEEISIPRNEPSPDIKELEEILTQQEPIIEPAEVEDEQTDIAEEIVATLQEENPSEETASFEEPQPEVEDITNEITTQEIPKEKEEHEEFIEETIPEFQAEETFDKVILDDIKMAFIKEIGPVGKVIFGRKLKKYNLEEGEIPKSKLENFIADLSEDIIEEDRREEFIKTCTQYLK